MLGDLVLSRPLPLPFPFPFPFPLPLSCGLILGSANTGAASSVFGAGEGVPFAFGVGGALGVLGPSPSFAAGSALL